MILRRIYIKVKREDWFAITIDVVIVVIGVFMGIQVANWNEERLTGIAELEVYDTLKEAISIDADDIEGQIKYNAFYQSQ